MEEQWILLNNNSEEEEEEEEKFSEKVYITADYSCWSLLIECCDGLGQWCADMFLPYNTVKQQSE